MKIAHISDLHLTTHFSENNLDDIETALQYIKSMEIDHLAITGDLTDNAVAHDLELLRDLFNSYNMLNSDKLSIVIGNHDIFGGVQTAVDIFNFPEKCKNINYEQKVGEFCSFFPEVFEGCLYLSIDNSFPFAKIINGILFIGLNSIAEYSKVSNPFASNGRIDLKQYLELADILDSYGAGRQKIILTHHHFNKMKIKSENFSNDIWQNVEKQTMKLRKKKRLFNLFNQHKIDLVLHGHYHESEEYFRKGIRFSNAGASFMGREKNLININIINVKASKIDIEIHRIKSKNYISRPVFSYNKSKIKPRFKVVPSFNTVRTDDLSAI